VVAGALGGGCVAVIRGSGMVGGVAVGGLHMAVVAKPPWRRQ
jgi:hypothetical protein